MRMYPCPLCGRERSNEVGHSCEMFSEAKPVATIDSATVMYVNKDAYDGVMAKLNIRNKELSDVTAKYDKAVAALQKLLKKTINYAESGLIDSYVMEDPDEMSLSDAVDIAEFTLKGLGEL